MKNPKLLRLDDAKTVRIAIYETNQRRARFIIKPSAGEARSLLKAMGFKLVSRFPHREYWKDKGGLRALITS